MYVYMNDVKLFNIHKHYLVCIQQAHRQNDVVLTLICRHDVTLI